MNGNLFLLFTLALLLCLMIGCSNDNDVIDDVESSVILSEVVPFEDFNIDYELVGVWQFSLTHLDIILIFNADGTGAERQGSSWMFAWTTENGYVIMDGEFSGKYSYYLTDSDLGRTLHLTHVEYGRPQEFYCVYTSYARCCCVRIARNYFFDMQLGEGLE